VRRPATESLERRILIAAPKPVDRGADRAIAPSRRLRPRCGGLFGGNMNRQELSRLRHLDLSPVFVQTMPRRAGESPRRSMFSRSFAGFNARPEQVVACAHHPICHHVSLTVADRHPGVTSNGVSQHLVVKRRGDSRPC